MDPLLLNSKELVVFNIEENKDSEALLEVTNNTDSNMIYCIRTNAKVVFAVKPNKFALKPGKTERILMTLKWSRITPFIDQGLPTRDKLEIDAMTVSPVFIDALNCTESEAKELIRNRFKANEEARTSNQGNTPGFVEVHKKRLSIVYNLHKENEEVPEATAESEVQEAVIPQRQLTEPKQSSSAVKILLFVIMVVIWSLLVFVLGARYGDSILPQ